MRSLIFSQPLLELLVAQITPANQLKKYRSLKQAVVFTENCWSAICIDNWK